MARHDARNLAAAILGDVDLSGSACAGSGVDFVDPDPSDTERIIREFCWRCSVVGACRTVGDELAPFRRYGAIYGARYYAPDEPAEGWEVAS